VKLQIKWVPVTWHGASLGCGWRRWPPDVEGNCVYIEQAVMNSEHCVGLQLGVWARGWELLTVKYKLVMKCYTGLELGWVLWNNLGNGKCLLRCELAASGSG
jgi:hypothetical protein